MKTLLQLILLMTITLSAYAQRQLVGEWKISSQESLILTSDNLFSMTKGVKTIEGSWEYVKNKKRSDELIMYINTKSKIYFIENIEKDEIELYDPKKETSKILIRIMESVDKVEDVEYVTPIEIKDASKKEALLNQKSSFDPFGRGRFVINPGYGFIDYLDSLPNTLNDNIASYSLLLESSLGSRIGLGIKLGYRSWTKDEEVQYDVSLYSAAARLTYHPNLIQRLDTYFGVAPIVRYGTIAEANNNEYKWSTDISPVVGARYYLFDRFALTGEFAYDTSSNVTVGFSILLNQ